MEGTISSGFPGTILADTCLGEIDRVLFHSQKYPGLDDKEYGSPTSKVFSSYQSNSYYLGTQELKGLQSALEVLKM